MQIQKRYCIHETSNPQRNVEHTTSKDLQCSNEEEPTLFSTHYCALFSTAYFGLFRVGELTSGSHPVLVKNVHVGRNKNKVLFMLLTSKTHGLYSRPQSIKISSIELDPGTRKGKHNKQSFKFCPYKLLRKYFQIRPKYKSIKEPFFVFSDRSPVKPEQMRTMLKDMLHKSGFDEANYNCMSLRIGRASNLLKLGVSVETIKKLGRWTSNSVFSYLRTL